MPLGHLRESAVQRITHHAFPSYLVSMWFLQLLRARTMVVFAFAEQLVWDYLFANQRD
jgi:hypothetical protein